MHAIDDLPNFEVSGFGSDAPAFVFDVVRLDGRPDIPRPFLHRHGYYHMLWLERANGMHMLDFESFAVRPHSVFFISPGQVHAWSSTIPATGYVINFSTEFLVKMYPRQGELAELPFFHIAGADSALYLSSGQYRELTPLVDAMEGEFRGGRPWSQDVIRSFLLILLTRLRRLHQPREAEITLPKNYSLTKHFRLLIDRHYLEFDTVQRYASALAVTSRRLNDAARSTTGKTPIQLIQDRLLLEAKRLLIQSDLGISEIAYRLNFDDPAYFSRFFKKHEHMTPVEFKRQFAGFQG